MKRGAGFLAVLTLLLAGGSPAGAAGEPPKHVVIVTLPGLWWRDIADARTPTIDRLIGEGAIAAISVRSAARRTSPERGYLTLGAGNRAYAPNDDPTAQLALPAEARFENGTAAEALARRIPNPRAGGVVHLGLAWLASQGRGANVGTKIGSLGEALADAGVRRAVVSAADLSPSARAGAVRRASVLGIVDRTGTVDAGFLTGLVREDPAAPFGVTTDPDALAGATRRALDAARVVLVEPGETPRADEFAALATPERRAVLRREALERTDVLLGRIVALLGPRDRLYVLAPSGHADAPSEHLTPLIAWGQGVARGWLTSPTTRRPGMATLSDVAPTVLDAFGLPPAPSMTGTVIATMPAGGADRLARLLDLDRQSVFRERYAATAVGVFLGMLGTFAAGAFAAFGLRSAPLARLLAALSYAILAVAPATLIVRALEVDRLGMPLAHLVLWAVVAGLAALAWFVPGPRWAGGVALLLSTASMLAVDVVAGSPLQLNGIFGFSPIVAGRFYGVGNLAYALLFAAGILGLAGLVDLFGHQRAPAWIGAGLVAIVVVDGLPAFGADFGGILAGVPAVLVTWWLARGHRLRLRNVAALGAVAVAVAAAASLADMTRPPEVRTHLGRFAAHVVSGGWPALWMVLRRKGEANLGLLGISGWTYTIPILLAVIGLLVARPTGPLRQVLPKHPVLRAGLFGALVAGVLGFAVNDSGIAIPAMVLAHVAPLMVLMAVQAMAPRASRPG